MATSGRKLNLHVEADRSTMQEVLRELGIHLTPGVLEFVSSKLPPDWLVAWASSQFNVRTTRGNTFGISLPVWAELVQSLFDLKDVNGIDEQVRRLSVPVAAIIGRESDFRGCQREMSR